MKIDFDSLPEYLQLLLVWNKFTIYDKYLGNLDLFFDYQVMRYFIIKELKNWYEIEKDITPPVDDSNYIKVWFHCDKMLNKESILAMCEDKEYNFKWRYNGYTAIEVK